jgi:pyruvate dehydrogenase E1 component
VLAQTKKGYGMGSAGQGRMTTHSQKKFDGAELIEFRNRFNLPLTDEQAQGLAFIKPDEDSPELRYLREHRSRLGGALPRRETACDVVPVPALENYAQFALQADGKEMSTTMAFVRLLSNLLKLPELGPRVVPIVADEARTFGMASLFRQVGIYAPEGQRYEPEDAASLMSYREARDGQILEEGISEAGALASWTAAATSYSTHGLSMLPFYIYYSMFGFQRVGDLIWAAADQRSRGFLLGATAGRTTLGGEGLQHQDGHSQLIASTVPNCVAWDPGYAYELALIVQHGLARMLALQHDVFFYITVMNQNHAQPSLPAGAEDGVLRGLYVLPPPARVEQPKARCTLLGSGAILHEVVEAARWLAEHWQVQAEVCSATSFSELARDGMAQERARALGEAAITPWATLVLQGTAGPIVAATDYVRAVPEQLRAWVPVGRRYVTLGTDGFGRSDSRAQLREFFEVSPRHVVLRALQALADDGVLPADVPAAARQRYGIVPGPTPWSV